jgi:hypothetical protein
MKRVPTMNPEAAASTHNHHSRLLPDVYQPGLTPKEATHNGQS